MRTGVLPRLIIVSVLGAAAVVGATMSASAAPANRSSLGFSAPPGEFISGGPASGIFASPSATFTVASVASVYTVTITSGVHTVHITIAPPAGKFTLGSSFQASASGLGAPGTFSIVGDGRTCASETSLVTVTDLTTNTGGAPTRVGIGFVDHCNQPTNPPVVGNLYINEPVLAPIPQTSIVSGPLSATPAGGPVSGTASAYRIAPAPPRQWVVKATVAGAATGVQYAAVAVLNRDTNGDGVPDTTASVDVCTFAASSTVNGCIGAVTIPSGTVGYGNTLSIEQIAGAGARVTVASGPFLRTSKGL